MFILLTINNIIYFLPKKYSDLWLVISKLLNLKLTKKILTN